jgi:hypothetical protein
MYVCAILVEDLEKVDPIVATTIVVAHHDDAGTRGLVETQTL